MAKFQNSLCIVASFTLANRAIMVCNGVLLEAVLIFKTYVHSLLNSPFLG